MIVAHERLFYIEMLNSSCLLLAENVVVLLVVVVTTTLYKYIYMTDIHICIYQLEIHLYSLKKYLLYIRKLASIFGLRNRIDICALF